MAQPGLGYAAAMSQHDPDTKADVDDHGHQEEMLDIELADADDHRDEKEREWEHGREETRDVEEQGAGASKEDFPADGKGEFETVGHDESEEPGEDHDRGIIEGA